MDIQSNKNELRRRFQNLRNGLEPSHKQALDHELNHKLQSFIFKVKPKVVHCYLPIGSEINLSPTIQFLLDNDITVVCPETLEKPMLKNWILNSLTELKNGRFNTQFPASGEEFYGSYELIIVPGLAFNPQNYRLGYGGGYYDHFLKLQPKATKLGLFYSFQKCDELSQEQHDIPLDIILTD